MSNIPSTFSDCATSIQGPLETIHAARDELVRFMETELAGVEALHQRIADRAQELDGRERRLDVQEQHVELQHAQNDKLAQKLESDTAALEAMKAEWKSRDAEREGASLDESFERQQQLESLRQKTIELSEQLEAMQVQTRESEERAANAQRQLDLARAEIEQQSAASDGPSQNFEETGISAEAVDELAEITAQLGQVREELNRRNENPEGDDEISNRVATLEHERTALESELELVRGRAAELSETAAAQQKMIAQERAGWADELKQMRRALEGQTQTVTNTETQSYVQATQAGGAPVAPTSAAGPPDSVLESIRAQFEQVQKDRARRRDQKGSNGSDNVAVL